MKTIILCVVLGLVCSQAYTQSFSGSTLTWKADQVVNIEQSDTMNMKCSFKTIAQTQFQWTQRNGSMNSTYQVTSVEGTWPDVSENGTVVLSLIRNGKTSKATIERTADGVFITMDLTRQDTPSHLRFRITSVE